MTTLASDGFGRTNASSLGSADVGGAYAVYGGGVWATDGSGAYYASGSGPAAAVLDTGTADVTISITDLNAGAGGQHGLAFRAADANNYWVAYFDGGTRIRVGRIAGGAGQPLDLDVGATLADGDSLKVVCAGTSISVYQNGVLVPGGVISSAFNQTATKHGLSQGSYTNYGVRYDNLLITTNAGAPAADHLAFTTQPVGGTSGALLPTQPVAAAKRADGSVDTAYAGSVVYSLNVVSGSPVLSGTTTVALASGYATATNLVVTGVGTWTLTATLAPLTAATSSVGTTSASGSSYASSSLTASNGTLLTAVVPEAGGPWVVDAVPSPSGSAPTIDSNALLLHSAQYEENSMRLPPVGGHNAHTDYRVVGIVRTRYQAHGIYDGELMIGGRMNPPGYNGYLFGWYRGAQWVLRKYRSESQPSSYFQVATAAADAPIDGSHTYEVIFVTNAANALEVTCKVDGALIMDAWTDAGDYVEPILTTGDAGVIAWQGALASSVTGTAISLDSLDVTAVPTGAQKLRITQQPGGAVPGAAFARQAAVSLLTYYSLPATGFADTITASLVSGPVGGALTGGLTASVNTGTAVATFATMGATIAGAYVIKMTSALYGSITTTVEVVEKTANFSGTMLGTAITDAGMAPLGDGGFVLEIRDGVQRANTAASHSGSVLARIIGAPVGFLTFHSGFFTTPGVSTVVPPPPAYGLAAGTPTYATLYKPDGTTALMDVAAGVGSPLDLSYGNISVGQRVQLECLVLRDLTEVITIATEVMGQVAIGGTMAGGLAEMPRVYYDTTFVAPSGASRTVGAGKAYADPLAAYAAAGWGDSIDIDPSFDWTPAGGGGAGFPAKTPDTAPTHRYITIRAVSPPCADTARTSPGLMAAAQAPKFRCNSTSAALYSAAGAHHLRFIGIEICPTDLSPPSPFALLWIAPNTGPGGQGNTYADMPHHIILDRMYVHGSSGSNVRHAVGLNGDYVAIINSHVSEIHDDGGDCTGVLSYMGRGPVKIVNNYLEAVTEVVFLGVPNSVWPGVVVGDVEIRYNTIAKDPAWRGVYNRLKNLLEMKGGKRVLIQGNRFKYNWEGNANWGGPGISLKTTSAGGDTRVGHHRSCDISILDNMIEGTGGMLNVAALPGSDPSTPLARLYVRNLLGAHMDTVPGVGFPNIKQALAIASDPRTVARDILIEHLTAVYEGGGASGIVLGAGGGTLLAKAQNVTVRSSVFAVAGFHPINGEGKGYSDEAMDWYWDETSCLWARNVLDGTGYEPSGGLPASSFLADNHFEQNGTDFTYPLIGFTNMASGDYSLAATRVGGSANPHKGYAHDGTDPGVDMVALAAALAGGSAAPLPAVPTHALIQTQPGGAVSGVSLTQQPVLTIRDDAGAVVTSYTGNIVATRRSGAGVITVGATIACVAGVGTFTGLTITGVDPAETLDFTPTGLPAVTSAAFAVTAPVGPVQTPTKVAILAQPTTVVSGQFFGTALVAAIEDVLNAVVTASTAPMTVALTSGLATLTGTTTRNAVTGIRSFADLVLTGAPGDITLTVSSPGLTAATVVAIHLTAASTTPVAYPISPTRLRRPFQSRAQGDSGPPLFDQLLNADGTPFDLTGCSVTYDMDAPDGTDLVSGGPVTIVTASTANVRFDLTTAHLTIPGICARKYNVTLPDGEVVSFPNRGFGTLTVTRQLT